MNGTQAAVGQNRDIPIALAIPLFLIVVAFAFLDQIRTLPLPSWDRLSLYASSHEGFLWLLGSAGVIDLIGLSSLCSRFFRSQRTGSRIEEMAGRKRAIRGQILPKLGAALIGGASTFLILSSVLVPEEVRAIPGIAQLGIQSMLLIVVPLIFASATFTLIFFAARFAPIAKIHLLWASGLPAFPASPNTVVLGSIGEEEGTRRDVRPSWVVLNQRALNGNILITGSIGSGKSQGAILPYLEQILSNFTPRPSILCIDPKTTFIAEAIKLISRKGLNDSVIHVRLDGKVSFNPIYHPDALRNAKFIDIAQMVRAAAVNFMGKAFDSPFWENASFNLIKNCLVYCAAVHRYYTLKDLYSTLVRAASVDDSFSEELDRCIASSDFDDEQKYNIACAKEYFQQEFKELEEKVRTGILATSTSFLNQFQEYRAAQVFCPPKELLTLASMDEVIDQGKIFLFDVANPGLARSMGTFVKLHYEQSLLDRLVDRTRGKARAGILLIDEYQDVVTSGYGSSLGDDRFLAKGREANSITIVATQSLTSLENSIGRDKPTLELFQNFRTKIFGHCSDLATIRLVQELVGQEEKERVSRSFSEHANHANRNLLLGGFESPDSNISESVSTSQSREYSLTGKEFSRLNTFECFAQVYDGIATTYEKLFWKPYYLKSKTTLHKSVLEQLKQAAAFVLLACLLPSVSHAFPNICSVVKAAEFNSCLGFNVGGCVCGFPPRPCAQISYYVPQSFVEVMPEPKSSFFSAMPGAAAQLAALGKIKTPFGTEGDEDSSTFQAHVTSVPFTEIPFSMLPCGGTRYSPLCLEGMSEHLGSHWVTGEGDLLQPNFLAWSLSPKGCLLKGAAMSVTGEVGGFSPAAPMCSTPIPKLPRFPPSSHSACTGWGTFYPRSGVYHGPAQTTAALMIGARMKSLSSEVLFSTPSSPDELWQMISPQTSSCFREGQNVGLLDTIKNVREIGRLSSGKLTGYLFVVWSKVSCCSDLPTVPTAIATIAAIQAACQGVPGL